MSNKEIAVTGFAVLVIFLLGTSSATASILTETISFKVSDPIPNPVFGPVIDGSFTISFDPNLSYDDSTDLSVNYLNPSFIGESGVAFSYSPDRAGIIGFGGLLNGGGTVYIGTSDFYLDIYTGFPPQPPALAQIFCSYAGDRSWFYTRNGTASITVPEPSSTAAVIGVAAIFLLSLARKTPLRPNWGVTEVCN